MSGNWQMARAWIMDSIASRDLAQGDKLPTEQELLRQIGVGRHSLRRAVASLAAEGVLSVEQGRGTFVRGQPRINYRIGRRTRFRENLESQGVKPGGETITADITPAEPDVARELSLPVGTPVHRILGRSRADDHPLGLNRSFHPAGRFPDLGAKRQSRMSVTDIYASYGVTDYRRRTTTIYARLPEKWEAKLLEQPADQPVIVMCKTDEDLSGIPIGWSEAIYAAGRIRFTLDFPE
ncbi:MAG: phosphonate metabolism transcriptional regulator PhnF [Rhodobacteraceae bacterium]|nr:phosphonate metabolism transcriptional regulator PhnF [Paracoccaceae bacterium]MBR9821145.1 phosphonate metabolism transcriptional regulator PhnF [Paracoccaceae bacterium]